MNELALFAGAGGGILGSILLGWRTVCAVEIDRYCACRLMQRQNEGLLEPFPIWDDVRTFDGTAWRGCVDVVSAGFPCQPFSVAGRNKGHADERNLWPDTIRIIRDVGPRFAFLENVPGLLAHEYFGTILGELAESGYDARWRCLSAAEVGAPHLRDRLWIVANAREPRSQVRSQAAHEHHRTPFAPRPDAHANSKPMERTAISRPQCHAWSSEPDVGRMVYGVPSRVERIKALGNAQVPRVVATAWRLLTEDLR